MKLKKDFITNSSSTSYVLCLPDKISDEDFQHLIEEIFNEGDFDSIEDVDVEEVKGTLGSLKAGDTIYQEDDDGLFYALTNMAEEKGWVINSIAAAGGDGCGTITVLTENEIKRIKEIRGL